MLYLCKNACGRFAIFDAFTASISPLLLFSSSDPRPEPSMQEWRREWGDNLCGFAPSSSCLSSSLLPPPLDVLLLFFLYKILQTECRRCQRVTSSAKGHAPERGYRIRWHSYLRLTQSYLTSSYAHTLSILCRVPLAWNHVRFAGVSVSDYVST